MSRTVANPARALRFCAILFSLTCISSLAIAGEVECSFIECDHSDPTVRKKILMMAYSYGAKGESEMEARILAAAIRLWQGPSQEQELRAACFKQFLGLAHREILDEQKDLLIGCPEEQIDMLYGRLDHGPIPIMKVLPTFPRPALRRKRTEIVIIAYEVDERGRVRDVKIVESSYRKLNSAIVRAARMATFLPASEAGKQVVSAHNQTRFTVHIDRGTARVEMEDMETGSDSDEAQAR